MFNFRSPSFKQTGLDAAKLGDDELIDLMLREPRLVRRPVVRLNGQVYFSTNSKLLTPLLNA